MTHSAPINCCLHLKGRNLNQLPARGVLEEWRYILKKRLSLIKCSYKYTIFQFWGLSYKKSWYVANEKLYLKFSTPSWPWFRPSSVPPSPVVSHRGIATPVNHVPTSSHRDEPNTQPPGISIYSLIWGSLIWDKREQLAQMAFPTIASLCPPITTTKGEGFYVELFLICAFTLE